MRKFWKKKVDAPVEETEEYIRLFAYKKGFVYDLRDNTHDELVEKLWKATMENHELIKRLLNVKYGIVADDEGRLEKEEDDGSTDV